MNDFSVLTLFYSLPGRFQLNRCSWCSVMLANKLSQRGIRPNNQTTLVAFVCCGLIVEISRLSSLCLEAGYDILKLFASFAKPQARFSPSLPGLVQH